MDFDSENEGDFDVIAAIGRGKSKRTADTPAPVRDESDEAELERLQKEYLWTHTFEVL